MSRPFRAEIFHILFFLPRALPRKMRGWYEVALTALRKNAKISYFLWIMLFTDTYSDHLVNPDKVIHIRPLSAQGWWENIVFPWIMLFTDTYINNLKTPKGWFISGRGNIRGKNDEKEETRVYESPFQGWMMVLEYLFPGRCPGLIWSRAYSAHELWKKIVFPWIVLFKDTNINNLSNPEGWFISDLWKIRDSLVTFPWKRVEYVL